MDGSSQGEVTSEKVLLMQMRDQYKVKAAIVLTNKCIAKHFRLYLESKTESKSAKFGRDCSHPISNSHQPEQRSVKKKTERMQRRTSRGNSSSEITV